ncbi:MAG: ATP-binding cassette domain-containing protein [bacterium]
MNEPVLSIKNISRNFRKVEAVRNVSLEVKPGEIFGLIGPDGAGKSTLIYLATGLLSAKSGTVQLLGLDPQKDPESVKSYLGILPQGLGLSLAAELSVEENINYFAEINGVEPARRETMKEQLLRATDLARFKDRPAKNLSGGMKQKLGLCCTLIHSPEMVFLDEPTTGVDPISRRDIWTLINQIVQQEKITIFLTTSYMDEAERCHRMGLMHQGEILAMGDIAELTSSLGGKLLEIQVDDQQKALPALKATGVFSAVYPMGHRINAIARTGLDGEAAVRQAAGNDGFRLVQVEEGRPALEDVFLEMVMKGSGTSDQEALEEFFKTGAPRPSSKKADGPMIEVNHLSKTFGKFTAVDKVTFDVRRGEIFGFLGPNGAGKTTTIKMLCGLFPPTSGTGRIAGFDLMKEQMNIKKSIGYMSQKFSLYRDLTVGENIELYAGIYGVPPEDLRRRKELLLRIADLSGRENAITDSLPMGIKQRLALGCTIIHQPEVIFLDEPTSGVDPVARRIFWDIIFFLSRKVGVTVLVTTHYMDEAEHCDRLSLMHMGKLIALGSPEELKRQVTAEIGGMLEILTDRPFESLELLGRNYPFCNIYGRALHLYTPQPERDRPAIAGTLKEAGIALTDLREKPIPFEDVFVYFCEKAERENKSNG